jgi:hypothetical protein
MLHVKIIKDLDSLWNQPTSPPYRLLELAEEWGERGEDWVVLEAKEEYRADPHWLLVTGEKDREDLLFLEGGTLTGRWDGSRNLFFDEDGFSIDLHGNRTSPGSKGGCGGGRGCRMGK